MPILKAGVLYLATRDPRMFAIRPPLVARRRIADPIPCCTLGDAPPMTHKFVTSSDDGADHSTIHSEKPKENLNDTKGY